MWKKPSIRLSTGLLLLAPASPLPLPLAAPALLLLLPLLLLLLLAVALPPPRMRAVQLAGHTVALTRYSDRPVVVLFVWCFANQAGFGDARTHTSIAAALATCTHVTCMHVLTQLLAMLAGHCRPPQAVRAQNPGSRARTWWDVQHRLVERDEPRVVLPQPRGVVDPAARVQPRGQREDRRREDGRRGGQ
jgi:hypothetical protein